VISHANYMTMGSSDGRELNIRYRTF